MLCLIFILIINIDFNNFVDLFLFNLHFLLYYKQNYIIKAKWKKLIEDKINYLIYPHSKTIKELLINLINKAYLVVLNWNKISFNNWGKVHCLGCLKKYLKLIKHSLHKLILINNGLIKLVKLDSLINNTLISLRKNTQYISLKISKNRRNKSKVIYQK